VTKYGVPLLWLTMSCYRPFEQPSYVPGSDFVLCVLLSECVLLCDLCLYGLMPDLNLRWRWWMEYNSHSISVVINNRFEQ